MSKVSTRPATPKSICTLHSRVGNEALVKTGILELDMGAQPVIVTVYKIKTGSAIKKVIRRIPVGQIFLSNRIFYGSKLYAFVIHGAASNSPLP